MINRMNQRLSLLLLKVLLFFKFDHHVMLSEMHQYACLIQIIILGFHYSNMQ